MPGTGSHVVGPGGLVSPQDHTAASRAVKPPDGEPLSLDPHRATNRDSILGKGQVQALA